MRLNAKTPTSSSSPWQGEESVVRAGGTELGRETTA